MKSNQKLKRFIALLRGINVGGNNKIRMTNLVSLLEGKGLCQLRTYIQSGNLVFFSDLIATDLEQLISAAIEEHYGYAVPTKVLEVEELKEIIEHAPWEQIADFDRSKAHFTFIDRGKSRQGVEHHNMSVYAPDQCWMKGNCVYVYCPEGYGKTKLHNGFFEKLLNTRATTRNYRTTHVLLDMCEQLRL